MDTPTRLDTGAVQTPWRRGAPVDTLPAPDTIRAARAGPRRRQPLELSEARSLAACRPPTTADRRGSPTRAHRRASCRSLLPAPSTSSSRHPDAAGRISWSVGRRSARSTGTGACTGWSDSPGPVGPRSDDDALRARRSAVRATTPGSRCSTRSSSATTYEVATCCREDARRRTAPSWRAGPALPCRGYDPRCGSNCCELLFSEAGLHGRLSARLAGAGGRGAARPTPTTTTSRSTSGPALWCAAAGRWRPGRALARGRHPRGGRGPRRAVRGLTRQVPANSSPASAIR